MKSSKQIAVALLSFALLVGCTGSQFSATDATAATSTTGITTTTGTTDTTGTATATATPSASATPQTCQTGYVDSSTYGCIPQNTCPDGQGWYQNSCIDLGWSTGNICQGICPAGATEMVHGICLKQIYECPPCTGFDGYQCYWGIHAPEFYHW